MQPESKRKTAKLISIITAGAGIAVMLGWVFDISALKSISPAWISMKFSTAFTFFLSGVILYFIAKAEEGELDNSYIVISIASLLVILIMGTMFFSTLLGVHTGEEDLFIKDTGNLVKSVVPGRPSVPTMACFIFIAAAGIITTFKPEKLKAILNTIGVIIGSIGLIAIAGYAINQPFFYYYISGVNSAIAVHTAIIFVLLGIGFLCL
ncbi:MAG: hypothetical protein LHV68_06505 [Elusimicrobia bacterium]|nr:hypothetical protein [Candidatus Liberimonas magnetica]